MVLSADTFNRTNSTTNLGTTNGAGTLDPLTWVQGHGTLGINSNQGYSSSLGGNGYSVGYVDLGTGDVDITLTLASGNAALSQQESAITREQAVRIATEHLSREPKLVCARIRRVVAWQELTWRRPSLFNAPPGIESSWVAYLEFPNDPPMSCSSTIIIVSRTTGAVLYAGDANDEG